MHEAVTEESIQKATALFWEQMLAMPIRAIVLTSEPESAVEARCIGTGHAVGACVLSGAWSGRIEIRLSPALAVEATAAMLMQPAETVVESDLLDATKEIANMVAGTIKSALPRPCAMSVPSAEIESEDFCVLPRTEDSVTVFFHHPAGELLVRVWQESVTEVVVVESKELAEVVFPPLYAVPEFATLATVF